ncbi:hypothetical protein UT300019_13450 [Clostridium sp. CTA-19]
MKKFKTIVCENFKETLNQFSMNSLLNFLLLHSVVINYLKIKKQLTILKIEYTICFIQKIEKLNKKILSRETEGMAR